MGRLAPRVSTTSDRRLPAATVDRLPLYLEVLADLVDSGVETIASGPLAEAAGVNSAIVRKDLSYLGTFGTRGVGYPARDLADAIIDVLGLAEERRVVIVGVGNLGRALASYDGFGKRGFHVAALVDADPEKVGTIVGGCVVQALSDLRRVVRREGISIGILATPAIAAQAVADDLVESGVTAILNFAPTRVEVPAGTSIRRVDLSTELQILSFYEQVHAVTDRRRA
ncbi:MAG: redox-sensing transcriptional repressor Rex [Actinobacteria bacterium]|nr:redox-sensing transcriptional repressor Rex [Actinomycetota bacterium]